MLDCVRNEDCSHLAPPWNLTLRLPMLKAQPLLVSWKCPPVPFLRTELTLREIPLPLRSAEPENERNLQKTPKSTCSYFCMIIVYVMHAYVHASQIRTTLYTQHKWKYVHTILYIYNVCTIIYVQAVLILHCTCECTYVRSVLLYTYILYIQSIKHIIHTEY